MSKILSCICIALVILFAGLTPLYAWAIPLMVGFIVIAGVAYFNGHMDERV